MPDLYFEISAAPVVIPALIVAVTTAVARLQHRGRLTPARLATVLVASLYGAALVAVTLFPFRVALGRLSSPVPWYDKINVIPLVTADALGFSLNILMTVPLGLLAPLIVRRVRSVGAAVLVGFGVSTAIELAQTSGAVLLGGVRTGDVNDIIANTAGTVLGFLLFRWLSAQRSLVSSPALAEEGNKSAIRTNAGGETGELPSTAHRSDPGDAVPDDGRGVNPAAIAH